jgi:hypothetical protein
MIVARNGRIPVSSHRIIDSKPFHSATFAFFMILTLILKGPFGGKFLQTDQVRELEDFRRGDH